MSEKLSVGASVKEKLSKLSDFLLRKNEQNGQDEKSDSQVEQTEIVDTDKTDLGSRLQEGRSSRGPFGVR